MLKVFFNNRHQTNLHFYPYDCLQNCSQLYVTQEEVISQFFIAYLFSFQLKIPLTIKIHCSKCIPISQVLRSIRDQCEKFQFNFRISSTNRLVKWLIFTLMIYLEGQVMVLLNLVKLQTHKFFYEILEICMVLKNFKSQVMMLLNLVKLQTHKTFNEILEI